MQPASSQHSISQSTFQSNTYVIRSNNLQQSSASSTSTSMPRTRQLEIQPPANQLQEKQELVMKLLMMSFEIQRKDIVVKNLLKQLEQAEQRTTHTTSEEHHQLTTQIMRMKRYTEDLQFKLSQMTITNNQLSLTRSSVSTEQEQRIIFLQQRNKQLEFKKIEIESQCQKLVTELKMMNFRLVNVESTQKQKNREMQNVISQLQKRLDDERKLASELKIVVQSLHEETRVVRESHQRMIKEFDVRYGEMQREKEYNDDMKKSQVVVERQKVEMTQQRVEMMEREMARVGEEVKFWRKKAEEQQLVYDRKEQELVGEIRRLKDTEGELMQLRHQLAVTRGQLEQRNASVSLLSVELQRVKHAYTELQQSRQLSSIQTHESYQQQVVMYQQSLQSYRDRVTQLQEQIDRVKVENRMLKRKPSAVGECASCKVMQSATTIKSSTKLQVSSLNLNEIIQQTQKLHDTTLKIEQILSSKRTVTMLNGYGGESRMSIEERSYYQ